MSRHVRTLLWPALAVAGGGTLGSALRVWLPTPGAGAWLSVSLVTNALACLIIGLLIGLRPHWDGRHSRIAWAFAAIGFCGGLSTFSGFALHVHDSLRSGTADGAAAALVAVSAEIAVGLAAVLIGERLARQLSGSRPEPRRGPRA